MLLAKYKRLIHEHSIRLTIETRGTGFSALDASYKLLKMLLKLTSQRRKFEKQKQYDYNRT